MQNYIDIPEDIKYAVMLKWLDENVVKRISLENNEPEWMLNHRLDSLKKFQQIHMPNFGPDISDLNFDEIMFFAKPEALEKYATDWEDVSPEIKEKFERLWIPEAERQYLAGAWGQYDSSMVYHKMKEKWEKKWIIFEDMNEALHHHEELVKKYFMNLIPNTDHKFAALHWAVWSWWTFIYVPEWVKLDEPLQAYFRMNTMWWWQFEHTLIIVEDNAQCNYIEWCSAPKFNSRALHAWCVEIYVWNNSTMRYSSVENWSIDTYNLNTKRATVWENSFMEWVWWNLWSWKTMLYPMSILKGDNSKAEHLSAVFASQWQTHDTGSKVLHIWKNTSSQITSKSVCKDWGQANYRWIVKILPSAENAVNQTECDTILVDWESWSDTIPVIEASNADSTVAHEASSGKIDETVLFYLTSRWVPEDKAAGMVVNWFVSPIVKKLPLEYAWELNKLIDMEMEGSVW